MFIFNGLGWIGYLVELGKWIFCLMMVSCLGVGWLVREVFLDSFVMIVDEMLG